MLNPPMFDSESPRGQDAPSSLTGPFCRDVPVLAVMELACREVETLDAPGRQLLEHVRGCPVCRRWYHNARRAYQATLKDLARPVLRLPRRIHDAAACATPGERRYDLVPVRDRLTGLDALHGVLAWRPDHASFGGAPQAAAAQRAAAAPAGSWWVSLCFTSSSDREHGNPLAELRPFDGRRVRLILKAPARSWKLPTRLDLDPVRQELVSPAECVAIEDPERITKVRIVPL
jgi:hypothetical protein